MTFLMCKVFSLSRLIVGWHYEAKFMSQLLCWARPVDSRRVFELERTSRVARRQTHSCRTRLIYISIGAIYHSRARLMAACHLARKIVGVCIYYGASVLKKSECRAMSRRFATGTGRVRKKLFSKDDRLDESLFGGAK